MRHPLPKRLAAEAAGSAMMLAAVVGIAQLAGAAVATALFQWLNSSLTGNARAVVVPHNAEKEPEKEI